MMRRTSHSLVGLLTVALLALAPTSGLAQPGRGGPPDFSRNGGLNRPVGSSSSSRGRVLGRSGAIQGFSSRNNALGRPPITNPARLLGPGRFGVSRGPTAAVISQRRGAQIYTVRERNGRVQRFAFNAPRAQTPLQIRTSAGQVGIRTVAFDIDGTLVDTRQTIADGIRAGLVAIGAPADESFVIDQTRGKPYSEVGHNALEHFRDFFAAREPGGQLSDARSRELQSAFVSRAAEVTERSEAAGNARAYPGAVALVRDLQRSGVHVVAVTSRPTASALALLRQNGMERHFDVVVGRQERSATRVPQVSVRGTIRPGRPMDAKPSPSSFLLALRRAGRDAHPTQTAFVGDMHTDLRTADAAGSTSIAITHGMDTVETLQAENPAATVHDIAELRTALGLDNPAERPSAERPSANAP